MEENATKIQSQRQPDPAILNWFEVTSNICLYVAGLIAVTILSGWFIPAIGKILPDSWALMQITSSLSILFISIALALGKRKNNGRHLAISRFFGILCIALVVDTLIDLWFGDKSVIGSLLVAKEHLTLVHTTSTQSATCFFILALSVFIEPSRQDKVGYILDLLIIILVMLNLLYFAGYLYKANNLIEVTSSILISPHTLICIALLTFVQLARRAPFGSYTMLVASGITGHTVRIVLPISVALIFLIILSPTHITSRGLLETPYAAAMTAVVSSLIMIIVVMLLSHKINTLEVRLHSMSITDELTGAYNLRGLNLHGKQLLLEAKRSGTSLSLLFIDVDGLKNVNDSLGHDVGSKLLCDVATLLHENFRESDIVSRVGGDEFVIIVYGSEDDVVSAINRLNFSVDTINDSGSRPYRIGFSIGKVRFEPRTNESLEKLIGRADAAMYKIKKERRASAANIESAQQSASVDAQTARTPEL